MGIPTNCHTEMSDSAIRAELSSPNQGWKKAPRRNASSEAFTMPHKGLSMSCQMNPAITIDSMAGIYRIVRYTPLSRSPRRVNNTASSSPIGFWTRNCTRKNTMLCWTAPQKRTSHGLTLKSLM